MTRPFHVQPNLQDWDWSPNAPDATFAAYQAEQGNLPARVVITKLPSREELRQKNLFSVAGAQHVLMPLSILICRVRSTLTVPAPVPVTVLASVLVTVAPVPVTVPVSERAARVLLVVLP